MRKRAATRTMQTSTRLRKAIIRSMLSSLEEESVDGASIVVERRLRRWRAARGEALRAGIFALSLS